MTLDLDPDAILWSAAPAERDGRPLLIVMHGRGSNEEDLFALAGELPPEFVIASLRAPLAESGGWSWWETVVSGNPDAERVDAAAAAVTTWLDALPFTPSRVGTLGFSQGGAMATHLLRRDVERIAFAVNLAGFAIAGEQEADAALAVSRPPVFWGRGASIRCSPPRSSSAPRPGCAGTPTPRCTCTRGSRTRSRVTNSTT